MKWILKDEVKMKIKTVPNLFADICVALKKSPFTLPDLLRKDDPQLTQKAILQIISKELNLKESELLEEIIAEESTR